MKKNLLLMMLCCPAVLAAQQTNGVTVSGLAVDAGTVTFNVQWTNDHAPGFLWSDTAWVFVDYNKNGVMERLQLSAGATLTATSAEGVGTVIPVDGNTQGVWVVGNARDAGTFSATVQLLTATADMAGACAYASNYPPVGEYSSPTEISFTGTPEYKVVLERNDKSSTYTTTVGQDGSLSISTGEAVLSFTDKTGAPGKLGCIPSTAYDLNVSALSFCTGVGVTFTLSGMEDGRKYELYRDGTPATMTTLMGDGSAATFSGTFDVAGVYTAASVADGVYCAQLMNGAHTIVAYPTFTAGEITSAAAATTTKAGTDPNVTIVNATPASGGDGSISYVWVRTGTSSATLTGMDATYTFSSDPVGNYGMVGTYSFNRYAKDATCSNAVYVAAAGTYTLIVEAGGDSQPQGTDCTYTEPAVVGTFAAFPNNYSGGTYVSLTDERDNKNYPVVKIGGRWIMARNLNYQTGLTYQTNSNAPVTTSGGQVTALIGSFWCPGTSSTTFSTLAACDVYGALYSWETAMMVDGKWSDDNRSSTAWGSEPTYSTNTNSANTNNGGRGANNHGICPSNWHVPTDGEWGDILNTMETGTKIHNTSTGWIGTNAGTRGKSKCTGTSSDSAPLWTDNSNRGTDVYGFRVLPFGRREDTNFVSRGNGAAFWSSSANSGGSVAWNRGFFYTNATVGRATNPRSYGFSVRCMRD